MTGLIFVDGVVTGLGSSHQPGSAFWKYEFVRARTADGGETVVRKVNVENDLTQPLRGAVQAASPTKMLFAKIPMFGTTLVGIETNGRSYAPGFVSSGGMSMKLWGLLAVVFIGGLLLSPLLIGIPIAIGAIYVGFVILGLAGSIKPEMQRRGFAPLATTKYI